MGKKVLLSLIIACILIIAGCKPFLYKDSDGFVYPAFEGFGDEQKWGYIDENGNFGIPPQYEYAYEFQDNGLAKVTLKGKVGIIDLKGNVVVPLQYIYINDFNEGLAIASKNNRYYIINEKGKTVFESDLYIYDYSEGLAAFGKEVNGEYVLYGYVNKNGKIVIEPNFKEAAKFENGRAIVKTLEGKYALIDKSGRIIQTYDYSYIRDLSEECMVFVQNNKQGYIDLNGNIIIKPQYYVAGKFVNGLAIVETNDNDGNVYGVVNKRGDYVIPLKYSNIEWIGNKLFRVSNDKVYSYNYSKNAIFDTSGKQLTDFKIYETGEFKDGVFSVSDENSTYFLNDKGIKEDKLPKLGETGYMSILGNLVYANIDGRIRYYSKDGMLVWKIDNDLGLSNGVILRENQFKLNRNTIIYYPQIENLQDKKIENKINKELVGHFRVDDDNSGTINISYGAKNFENFIIINKNGYYYTPGAAHGYPTKEYIYLNINNGKFYTLPDLFAKNSNYVKRISDIIKKQVDEQSKKPDSMLLIEEFDKIKQKQDFIITKDGITIYFHPYEIAAYAAGFPEFKISYDEIKDMINSKGDLWKLVSIIKKDTSQ